MSLYNMFKLFQIRSFPEARVNTKNSWNHQEGWYYMHTFNTKQTFVHRQTQLLNVESFLIQKFQAGMVFVRSNWRLPSWNKRIIFAHRVHLERPTFTSTGIIMNDLDSPTDIWKEKNKLSKKVIYHQVEFHVF